MQLSESQIQNYYTARLPGQPLRANGNGEVRTKCLFHEDETPSLSINLRTGQWYCHAGCGSGGIVRFERKVSCCDARTAWTNIAGLVGQTIASGTTASRGELVATYPYHDAQGRLLFEKLRFRPKGFVLRRPVGNGYEYNLNGIYEKPLYRLLEVLVANEIIVVEGCKDVETIRALNLGDREHGQYVAATTNFDGAGKWRDEYAPYFAGKKVVVLPDNDEAGRKHAEMVARSVHPHAAGVKVVHLPGLAEHGDVSDYMADHAPAELLAEIAKTPLWHPINEATSESTPIIQLPESAACPPQFADDALTLRFTNSYGETLRYTASWGKWYRYDGQRWVADTTLHIFDLARGLCRLACSECGDEKAAPRIASAATIGAVERLARSDRRHASAVDQWDADPWLLCTPAGTLDLSKGDLRENRPEDYLTKITSVAPDYAAECPLWFAFLNRVTDGDRELQAFLQRIAGYCLTGTTGEHALFFLYGTGANGKSVFVATISGILGDYTRTAPIESFTASQTERHPTDMAGLQGARLVTAMETEDGRRWAESKIKMLTGGDVISARFMRQDFFDYKPQFKLLISGNHKPGLRTIDEAIRRRLHLIPFTVTIPEQDRDRGLAEKLKAEWPGILAWAAAGCAEWRRQGLNPPRAVLEATAEYLEAEDAMGRWLEERCDRGSNCCTRVGALYEDWKQWCEINGEYAGSKKSFSQHLTARGYHPTRLGTSGSRAVEGLMLKSDLSCR